MADADGAGREEEAPPLRPSSPFVSRLRLEVALAREDVGEGGGADPRQGEAAAEPQGEAAAPPDNGEALRPARPATWELQPSIATWLTPRGSQRSARRRSTVSFAEQESEVLAITHRGDSGSAAASPGAVTAVPPAILELCFKGTAAKPFKLEGVEDSTTVLVLKDLCQERCSLPPEHMRLLYKGAVLQDSQTLVGAKIPNKATLFLVKGAASNTEPARLPEARAAARAEASSGPPCMECGVNPGRPQTDGLCPYCFRELVQRENAQLKAAREEARRLEAELLRREEERQREEAEWEAKRQKDTTRCYACGKKTGLTGFQCKCGYFFCATHRYAEDHGCTFDHKGHGRKILAEQNPKLDGAGAW
mmetsp:Transcript_8781/g.18719  ORF Transcript_8781/g.18719 Transcript_8781/m.18719 type:complete len:364 (+) Transcript_8781:53-1144(+)